MLGLSGKAEINTQRQYELDLLKALAIISMIICHAVIMLGAHHIGYEKDIRYLIGDYFFGCYLAVAHAFMFAMGLGIVFSQKNSPAALIRRGIRLYILAFILNFFRYGIYALADGIIEGRFMEETVYALTCQDILHFAGLALIVTGIFKHFRLNELHIMGIGLLLSVVGAALAFADQGSYLANYILGHFIVTTEECSCFAFFNWYIFVAAGILFGSVIRRVDDTDAFYGRMLQVACPVLAIYVALSAIFGAFFLSKNGWYYGIGPLDAAGLLSIDLALLGGFHFILKKVDVSRLSTFISMSRDVNQIYLIHWCILGFIDSIFCYLLGFVFPWSAIYIIGIALIIVSYRIAKWWSGRKQTMGPA